MSETATPELETVSAHRKGPDLRAIVEVSSAALELVGMLARGLAGMADDTRSQLHALFDLAIQLRRRGVFTAEEFDLLHEIVAGKLDGAPAGVRPAHSAARPRSSPLRAIRSLNKFRNHPDVVEAVPLDDDPHAADVLDAEYLADADVDAELDDGEVFDALDLDASLDDPEVCDALELETLDDSLDDEGATGLEGIDGGDGWGEDGADAEEGGWGKVGSDAAEGGWGGADDPGVEDYDEYGGGLDGEIPGLADVPDGIGDVLGGDDGGGLGGLSDLLED